MGLLGMLLYFTYSRGRTKKRVVWRLLIFSGFLSGTQRNGTKRWSFHDYKDTPFSLHTRGRMRTGVPLRRMDTISFSRSMMRKKSMGGTTHGTGQVHNGAH